MDKLFQTFDGEVVCHHGNQDFTCRRKYIDSQHIEGRAVVQQYHIVLVSNAVQIVP